MSGSAARREAIKAVNDYSIPDKDFSEPLGRSVRQERLRSDGHEGPTAEERLEVGARDDREGGAAGAEYGRLGRLGDARLGPGERGFALRPRVLPAHRPDCGEARLVPGAGRRQHLDGPVHRQDPAAGRAGRLQLPQRRSPQHLRGPRLYRLGCHQPCVHPGESERQHPLHPDDLHLLDRRGAGQEDAPAAVPAGDERPCRPGAQALRAHRHRHGGVLRRGRAGVLPDRRALLLRPPGPDERRSYVVRGQAVQGPGVRRPLLRPHPRAGAGVHDRSRPRAVQAGHPGQDPAQRGRARPVRDRPAVREGESGP